MGANITLAGIINGSVIAIGAQLPDELYEDFLVECLAFFHAYVKWLSRGNHQEKWLSELDIGINENFRELIKEKSKSHFNIFQESNFKYPTTGKVFFQK